MTRYLISVLLATTLLGASATRARANADDDTLRGYLGKSELVVVGTISKIVVSIVDDAGAPEYTCDFQIDDVIKPDPRQTNSTISVTIKRFEIEDGDKHPLLAENKRSILFLKRTYDAKAWETVDYWFGVQYPSPTLISSLKRLAKE